MKQAGIYILAFAFSLGLTLFFLRPEAPAPNEVPFNPNPPIQERFAPREVERTTNVSVYEHTFALIDKWVGGPHFGDPDEKTWHRDGYAKGEGTLFVLSIHEHIVGTFDGNSSTDFHFQLPDKITQGETYEILPMTNPDGESRLPVGRMHVFVWGNPMYARSLVANDLKKPASIEILKIDADRVRFKLAVGAVDWLDELPIDDIFDGAIAR